MGSAGLPVDQVWLYYFSLGGEAGMYEVDAFLHHGLHLPRLQRDIFAHAINELNDFGRRSHAPYASDITQGDAPAQDRREENDSDPS